MLWDRSKRADSSVEGLNDLFHSMGAIRIAAVFSIVAIPLVALTAIGVADAGTVARLVCALILAIIWLAVVGTTCDRLEQFARFSLEHALMNELVRGKKLPPPFM